MIFYFLHILASLSVLNGKKNEEVKMANVLLVEDDPALGKGLVVMLELQKHTVTWAKNLATAQADFDKKRPDLVLLDLNLPDGNGITLLKSIRRELTTPVIILTAKTDEDSVVEGLESGANDYIRKPFGQKELKARVESLLREKRTIGEEMAFGGLRLIVPTRRVYYGEREISLTRREYQVLFHFLQRPDTVVSREALISAIATDEEVFDRTIDSHVSHLRSRLRKAEVSGVKISSIYGVGYRLEIA